MTANEKQAHFEIGAMISIVFVTPIENLETERRTDGGGMPAVV